MLIKIDKDGRRLVSVTKPERKKLTDAMEFGELGIVQNKPRTATIISANHSFLINILN